MTRIVKGFCSSCARETHAPRSSHAITSHRYSRGLACNFHCDQVPDSNFAACQIRSTIDRDIRKKKTTIIDDVTRVSILFVSQVERSLYSQRERIYFISNISLLETFYSGTYGTLGNFSECYCRGERTIVIDVYVHWCYIRVTRWLSFWSRYYFESKILLYFNVVCCPDTTQAITLLHIIAEIKKR